VVASELSRDHADPKHTANLQPVTWLARYAAVVREAGVAPAFAASILGRLSLGMTGLAILLLVRQSSGSYADAGAVSAAYSVAFAVGAPRLARRADRRGPGTVLVQCALLQPVALGCLALLGAHDAPSLLLAVPAVVAGVFVPPLSAVMRALWAARLSEPSLPAAYSLESVLVELCFVLGPAIVATMAAWPGPAAAVAASAVVSTLGALGMAASAGVRAVRPENVAHSRVGPLSSGAVRALLLTVVFVGTSFGAVEVAMPAFAEETGSRPGTAGVLLALWAAGSMAGGLVYGGVAPQRPHAVQMRFLVSAMAIAAALPLVAPGKVSMGLALIAYGTTIAPFMACNALLLGRSAPRGTTTEAFAWNSSMIVAGTAIGTALAGFLIERVGTTGGLAVTAAAGALTLAVSFAGRRQIV
jgi:predicted MFS family arabinose efflux permease